MCISKMPKNLIEAIRYFTDEQTCINAVAFLRWEDRVFSDFCGSGAAIDSAPTRWSSLSEQRLVREPGLLLFGCSFSDHCGVLCDRGADELL
jgi:hypothetical protein